MCDCFHDACLSVPPTRCVRGMFIVAMIVATVGAIVTIVLYGSVLNGMGAETLRGFLKVKTKIFGKLYTGLQ